VLALKILLAEDDAFTAELLRQLLDKRGHPCHVASNGDDALTLVATGDFDLLFLDLRMPGRDGFEVIQRVRGAEGATGKHMPLFVVTARLQKEDRKRCLDAGADGFLAKPIDASALWTVLERLELPDARDDGARWLDARVLLAACDSDAVILERIGHALRAHVPAELARAEASFRERHAGGLREAAHRLCGMLGAASSSIGQVASDLEDAAAAGRLGEAGVILRRLARMIEALLPAMEGLSLERLRRHIGERAYD